MVIAPEASRVLIDQVLSRMVRSGEIERVSRGMFSRPEIHPDLGPLAPQSKNITETIERNIGSPVIPAGALALNELHLSNQVPVHLEFITPRPSRLLYIGKRKIHLRHAPAIRFRSRERIISLVVEASRALGKQNITASTVNSLRDILSDKDRLVLKKI
jgi:hypothetical protein